MQHLQIEYNDKKPWHGISESSVSCFNVLMFFVHNVVRYLCCDCLVIPTNLEFHLSNEFERLQGKEADCNLLLKTDFQKKNLQRGKLQ